MTTRVIIAIFVIASTLALVLSAGEVKSTFFDVTSTVARSKWDTLDSAKKTSFLGFLEQIHNSYHIDNYGKNFTIQEFQRKIENNEITQEEINLVLNEKPLLANLILELPTFFCCRWSATPPCSTRTTTTTW